jgi:hypothetical protein
MSVAEHLHAVRANLQVIVLCSAKAALQREHDAAFAWRQSRLAHAVVPDPWLLLTAAVLHLTIHTASIA